MNPILFVVFFLMPLMALLGVWINWIVLDDDCFSTSKRPNFFEFYFLGLLNFFRFFILKRPLLLKEFYPQYFPIYSKKTF
jgi:hypothetical protein